MERSQKHSSYCRLACRFLSYVALQRLPSSTSPTTSIHSLEWTAPAPIPLLLITTSAARGSFLAQRLWKTTTKKSNLSSRANWETMFVNLILIVKLSFVSHLSCRAMESLFEPEGFMILQPLALHQVCSLRLLILVFGVTLDQSMAAER